MIYYAVLFTPTGMFAGAIEEVFFSREDAEEAGALRADSIGDGWDCDVVTVDEYVKEFVNKDYNLTH